jgi:hypothetical protein
MGLPPPPLLVPVRSARDGPIRKAIPVLALLVALAVVVFGGFAMEGVLSRPAGPPVTVGGLVRIFPVAGWQDGGHAQSASSTPSALLSRGSGNLEIHAFSFRGDSGQLLREYVTRFLEPQARRLSVSSTIGAVRLDSGVVAARIAYVGLFAGAQGQIEGQITAVAAPGGLGAVFDGWAPVGLLHYVLDDIHTMVQTAEVD